VPLRSSVPRSSLAAPLLVYPLIRVISLCKLIIIRERTLRQIRIDREQSAIANSVLSIYFYFRYEITFRWRKIETRLTPRGREKFAFGRYRAIALSIDLPSEMATINAVVNVNYY